MSTSALSTAISELVERSGEQGVSMGSIVDTLEREGHAASDVEIEIWRMMSSRRLTPSGFICRSIRRATAQKTKTERAYEFLLVAWSPELDGQLELNLSDAPKAQ